MGLFSRKPQETDTEGVEWRGGCADHDMRGPVRKTFKQANRDALDHGTRMHGTTDYPGGYVEGTR